MGEPQRVWCGQAPWREHMAPGARACPHTQRRAGERQEFARARAASRSGSPLLPSPSRAPRRNLAARHDRACPGGHSPTTVPAPV